MKRKTKDGIKAAILFIVGAFFVSLTTQGADFTVLGIPSYGSLAFGIALILVGLVYAARGIWKE
jgi:hypothetical protein